MLKRHYALAIGSFLLIPVITVSGVMLFNAIYPEAAPGHPNYGRNDWLLIFLVATLLVSPGLWFLTMLADKAPPAACGHSARGWKSCIWWFSSICWGRFVSTSYAVNPNSGPPPKGLDTRAGRE